MTKAQFVERHRDELCGLIAQAAVVQATGGPLAILLRSFFRKVDLELSAIYDVLKPETPAIGNGKPQEAVKR